MNLHTYIGKHQDTPCRDNWDQCLGVSLFGAPSSDLDDKDRAFVREMSAFYFKDVADFKHLDLEENLANMTNLFTDAMFAHGTDQFVR